MKRIGLGMVMALAGTLLSCGGSSGADSSSSDTWAAGLQAEGVIAATVQGTSYSSSTKLGVAWTAPNEPVDHYELTVREGVGETTETVTVEAGKTEATLGELKSGTEYEISIRACLDANCEETREGDATAIAATEDEYWQVQGTGNTYEDATQVVDEGNNIPSMFRYGEEAGEELAGKVRLYFNPFFGEAFGQGQRIAMAKTQQPATEDLETVSFYEFDPSAGIMIPPDGTALISHLSTFQAVPLSSGTIRLFFEAQGEDGNTRYFYIDSQDGYQGRDFLPGEGAMIDTQEKWESLVEPKLVLDVDGDTGLTNARQSKIGWPVLDSWSWDQSPGTFMVITGSDGCEQTQDGLFYAVWSGSKWNVVQDDSECAKPLVPAGHGPVVVHLGGGRYKLYYEDETDGHMEKPFHVLYAESSSGMVDFTDWESHEDAREVHFLWPDGSLLNADDEAGLGDHMIFCPTADLSLQVMYMNLGGHDHTPAMASLGVGMAVLVNP